MTLRRFLALAACVAAPAVARTQAPSLPDSLQITLITFGQDVEVFERFGHNALWFYNPRTGENVAYQWGLFSFEQPHFIARFLTGDTRYWMGTSGATPQQEIDFWRRRGRPVTLQRLNLTAGQARKLHEFVQWNARDENKFYRYDYFQDNCSTRLRDALNLALDGMIKRATDTVITETSYRRESLRLTDGVKPLQLGIDIALGRPADKPLTEWQSFFIPMRMRDGLRLLKNGNAPLVASEHVVELPVDQVVFEVAKAPRVAYRYGLLGLLLALVVIGLRVMSASRRTATWGLALFGATWSLLCGVLGSILLLAWLVFTKHVFWASNENVLLLSPVSLVLVPVIPLALLKRRAVAPAAITSGLIALGALIALLLATIPGGEENRAVVAVFLPVHLTLAWALRRPAGTA